MRSLLALLLVACAPAPDEVEPFDAALAERLQEALDASRPDSNAPGAAAGVLRPDGTLWIGTSGWADTETNRHPVYDDRWRLGSITKTFTASVILELEAEGALDLDDPIAILVPDAPHGSEITIRMLLSHTSGLDDFVQRLEFLGNPLRDWTPEDLIAIIADDPLLFEPGTSYEYSNAGFILLGMAIEAATGRSWEDEVYERLIAPLWLFDIGLPSKWPETDTSVTGYLGGQPATDVYNPNAAWAAGEMVSDADDLLAWGRALYSGEVLGPDATEAMTTAWRFPNGEHAPYGLGCQVARWYERRTLGHSGSTMGFEARLRYDVETGLVTVAFTNDFVSEADVVDAAIWGVLVEEGAFD